MRVSATRWTKPEACGTWRGTWPNIATTFSPAIWARRPGTERVLRGGGWIYGNDYDSTLLSAARGAVGLQPDNQPFGGGTFSGFRAAWTVTR